MALTWKAPPILSPGPDFSSSARTTVSVKARARAHRMPVLRRMPRSSKKGLSRTQLGKRRFHAALQAWLALIRQCGSGDQQPNHGSTDHGVAVLGGSPFQQADIS